MTVHMLSLRQKMGRGLCLWFRFETVKQIMICPTCNVHLSLECYCMFHTNSNVVGIKAVLTKTFNRKQNINTFIFILYIFRLFHYYFYLHQFQPILGNFAHVLYWFLVIIPKIRYYWENDTSALLDTAQ